VGKLTSIEEARKRQERAQAIADGLKRGIWLPEDRESNAFAPGRVIKKDPREIARTLDPKLD
jgi:hypothetical protein